MRNAVRALPCLCKARISIFNSLSALTGFILAGGPAPVRSPALFAGVFLLACGACALNQVQEHESDAGMARTAGRPIPSGRIQPRHALGLALSLILLGEGVLLCTGNVLVPLLGLGSVFWYNGFYTWLKKRSAFAVVPGALVGAIPPAMGWVAAGGRLADPPLASLAFFFFMWQVPHFWLHLLRHGKEYTGAGLPSLTSVFSTSQLERLTFHWVSATAVSALLMGLYGLLVSPPAKVALLAASLWFGYGGFMLMIRHEADPSPLFRRTNHFMLVVMLLIFLDKLPFFAARLLSFF